MTPAVNNGRPRVLLYSHDSYGLGHLRRSLQIASGLAVLDPAPSVLVATGSPRAQSFHLPDGCDTLNLPAATKDAAGGYRSRSLGLPIDALVRLRADLLDAAGRSFEPDLVVVDHAPAGMAGELRGLLARLAASPRRPRLVLGLRDVIDHVAAVRREWDELGVWELIERVYDRVLVYGDPKILTTAEELGLPRRYPGKLRFVGYLASHGSPVSPDVHAVPTVVVTTGGGGDGHHLLRAYADFLEREPHPASFRSVVVVGPLLSRRRRDEIERRFRALGHPVEVLTFSDRMTDLLAQASAVVSMAGYNTVVEVLSARVPVLLMPRQEPRREQALRAERLRGIPGITVAPEDEPEQAIARFVYGVIHAGNRPQADLDLHGVAATTQELAELLYVSAEEEKGVAHAV